MSATAVVVLQPRPRLGALRSAYVSTVTQQARCYQRRRIRGGTITPSPYEGDNEVPYQNFPFYFDTGFGLYAKRPSRPFPPPFLSPPSGSFSDPLSTHDRSRDRRPKVNGQMIRGITNGDDAVLVQTNFIGANDGVGAWHQKPRGHAALWSRLVLHFWALEADKLGSSESSSSVPDPTRDLQTAYEHTMKATSEPNEWFGTTTACAALLHHTEDGSEPLLYATNVGDSQIMVLRPSASLEKMIVYKSEGQWHWFDCPFQLGTNSTDVPSEHAQVDKVKLEEGDIVLAMSDGVPDNLWEHEVADKVVTCLNDFEKKKASSSEGKELPDSLTQYIAQELVDAARVIAEDPYAESPYMERAIEEGLAAEGGKLDDISVVVGVCRKRDG